MAIQTAISDGNLPAEPNSFVGRERDLAELARLLSDVRALTLCGPGGIGKTRLALRLACEVVPDFPDGAWLIELSDTGAGDTGDAVLVGRRVAATFGVREEPDRPLVETLTAALRPRRLLLILDTCEHVVDGSAALVQQLLAGCPGLRVIATSREPLRVRGETVWRVPPLELPIAGGDLSAADLEKHEAIRLFTDRAAAVRPGFALDADNSRAVVRVCRTLDGMPLAIELAAARVGALSVEQIAARVGDRFQLLASGDRTAPVRQQTLRAAVDWSYELLTEPEQLLLRRLAVFAGWNLDMAEQVCADEAIPAEQVLDLLAALIDKSLVTLDGELEGDARYRLLDTIREYATSRLDASGEGPAVRLRHRDYMLRLMDGIVDVAFVRGDPPWPVRVALYRRALAERANCRAALGTCLSRGDVERGLRLCTGLRSPWVAYGDAAEGAAWFDRFLARRDGDVAADVRARALMARAELAFEQQDYPGAGEFAQAGLDLCQASGSAGAAAALRVLAVVSLRAGRYEDATASIEAAARAARDDGDEWEEGLALAVKATIMAHQNLLDEAQQAFTGALEVLRDNNGWGVAQALYGLGGVARARGDHAEALARFRDALMLYREIDARPEIARCLTGIGWAALSQGDLRLARSSLTESLQLSLATGQRLAVARELEAFAVLEVASGQLGSAVKLQGAALGLREAAGHPPSPQARSRLDDLVEAAGRELGQPAAAALLADGAAMSAHEAVRFAAATSGGGASGDAAPVRIPAQAASPDGAGAAATLTPRELEITGLIARGLSNRGIADELVISPATAARHVANIFGKLGFTSRAQVAAWAAQRESGGRG